jgi:hypothetical protein
MRVAAALLLAIATPALAQESFRPEQGYPRGDWIVEVHRDIWTDKQEMQAFSKRTPIVNGPGEAQAMMVCRGQRPILAIRWPDRISADNLSVDMRWRAGSGPIATTKWRNERIVNRSAEANMPLFQEQGVDLLGPAMSAPHITFGPRLESWRGAVISMAGAKAAYEDMQRFCTSGAVPSQ